MTQDAPLDQKATELEGRLRWKATHVPSPVVAALLVEAADALAAAPSIPEGKAEPVCWVTPETLADLLNDAPWAAGAIGELSQRKKDNYTAPLYATPVQHE